MPVYIRKIDGHIENWLRKNTKRVKSLPNSWEDIEGQDLYLVAFGKDIHMTIRVAHSPEELKVLKEFIIIEKRLCRIFVAPFDEVLQIIGQQLIKSLNKMSEESTEKAPTPVVDVMNLPEMAKFKAVKDLVASAEVEAIAFYTKSNKSAGGRLRKIGQEIRVKTQELRVDVHEKKSLITKDTKKAKA